MYKTDRDVLYAYDQGPAPVVDCEPLRTTDIQLQGGETITDVAMGDTERWMATPASSGDPSDPVPHLAVKPQAAGIATNLTIYTTKHIYHLSLRSRPGHAMQEVEFYYPDEVLDAMKKADATAAKAKAGSGTEVDPPGAIVPVASVDPGQLNFSYTISGPQMPWKPDQSFRRRDARLHPDAGRNEVERSTGADGRRRQLAARWSTIGSAAITTWSTGCSTRQCWCLEWDGNRTGRP